jgi:hypothetical protein
MSMGRDNLDEVLQALGQVLQARGLAYEIVVVGGSSLLLLGFITRPTRDLDALALVVDGEYVSARPLPEPFTQAIASVGRAFGLSEEWLNPGPTDILRFGLPEGFQNRVDTRRYGSLTVVLAGRLDQICLKLYATVDQGMKSKHAADLIALLPSDDELLAAARWSQTQDPSEGFKQSLAHTLAALGVEEPDDLI